MNYLENNVERLQFEISNVCNLHCLGCVRTTDDFIGTQSSLDQIQYVSTETFEKIIYAPEFKTVKYIEFCGSIDDPAAHPEFLEFVKITIACGIKLNKKFTLQIHTNGSLRNVQFWKDLGILLTENTEVLNHSVMFNIDGLEDSNHIYRQGSNWSKIMENSQALIDEGACVIWQYLTFPWNADQIEEAYDLSIKKGFDTFVVRRDRNRLKTISFLEKKTSATINDISAINSKQQIECPTQQNKMYFIDYKSRLWPCCFIPGAFVRDEKLREHLNLKLFERYDSFTWNDCSKQSIGEILNHKFYTEDLVDSWQSNNHDTGTKDRIFACSLICSTRSLQSNPIGDKSLKNYKNIAQ